MITVEVNMADLQTAIRDPDLAVPIRAIALERMVLERDAELQKKGTEIELLQARIADLERDKNTEKEDGFNPFPDDLGILTATKDS